MLIIHSSFTAGAPFWKKKQKTYVPINKIGLNCYYLQWGEQVLDTLRILQVSPLAMYVEVCCF